MAKKKPEESTAGELIDEAAVNPWKPLSACFLRTDEIAAAEAAGIDPDKAKVSYVPETRDGVDGVCLIVEEA
jgi:hypothetical protein